MAKQQEHCVYCGSLDNLTVDHVVPISCWQHSRIRRRIQDNPSNRVVACWTCNQEKANKLPYEWFALHPEYKVRFRQEAQYISDTVKKWIDPDH